MKCHYRWWPCHCCRETLQWKMVLLHEIYFWLLFDNQPLFKKRKFIQKIWINYQLKAKAIWSFQFSFVFPTIFPWFVLDVRICVSLGCKLHLCLPFRFCYVCQYVFRCWFWTMLSTMDSKIPAIPPRPLGRQACRVPGKKQTRRGSSLSEPYTKILYRAY